MKIKLRLLFKLSGVCLLFIAGILIAAVLFPSYTVIFGQKAKHYKDSLKMLWLQWFAIILNCQTTVKCQLPEPGVMLVCNHISWLDIVAIGRHVPGYFVAKSDILDWPVIGYLAKQAGAIFIRRGDKKQIHSTTEKMLWLLKQRSSIMAFPEGTTTCGVEVLPFHASLFQPALLTRANIQPVAIRYRGEARQQAPFVGDDEFLPHLFKILTLERVDVVLDFLPVLYSAGKTRIALSDTARTVIRTALLDGGTLEVSSEFSQKATV